jgi:DNA-binding PadR family transcriptional regulator
MSTPNLNLTPTSFAILGMVGHLRSCTTYELGKAMQASFDYFWPRARSLVYAEVKRLAALGQLDARKDFVGKRPRTTYTLTPAGREALVAWLQTTRRRLASSSKGCSGCILHPSGPGRISSRRWRRSTRRPRPCWEWACTWLAATWTAPPR